MKRKVIQLAGKTLVVSLPSKWAKEHGLKKGDEVELNDLKNGLLLSTEAHFLVEKFEKDITNTPKQLIEKTIIAAYKSGYDEIMLTYKSSKTSDLKCKKEADIPQVIAQIIDNLMGMEVVSQGVGYTSIKQITQISDEEFDNVLRRIYLILLEESELSKEFVIKEVSQDKISNMQTKYKTIRKLILYCLRVLNKKGYRDSKKTAIYHALLLDLDELNSIFNYIVSENTNNVFSKFYDSLFIETNKSLRILYELQYKFDMQKAKEIIFIRRAFFNMINSEKIKRISEATLISRLTMIILKHLQILELLISLNN